MNLDMQIQGGQIGGSSGFLDWGSDIGRMWGIGMQNGLNMSNAFRDHYYRSMIEPGEIEAKYMQNELAKQRIQNQSTREYDQLMLDNYRHSAPGGVLDYNGARNGVGGVATQPHQIQQVNSIAPRSTTNTVVPNGVSGGGYTNSSVGYDWRVSPTVSTALHQGTSNSYGKGD